MPDRSGQSRTTYPTAFDPNLEIEPPYSTLPTNAEHDRLHGRNADAINQLATKLGLGQSVPTTTGDVLVVTGPGQTAYQSAGAGSHPNLAAHDALGLVTEDDLDAHEIAADPHVQYALSTELADHAGAADPHTGYQRESEKGLANGYASLDSGGTVPDAQIPASIARDSELPDLAGHVAAADPHTGYVREADANWVDLTDSGETTLHSHAGGGAHPDLAAHDTLGLATQAELDAHINDAADAHDASAISILDSAADFTATDVEGALAELQADAEAHAAAADPHTGYVKENDANWVDLTDSGETTLHSHAGGGGSSLSFIRANVNRTLPNDLNLNAIFNDPANGRLTLTTGVYRFTGMFIITSMSATSGNALINLIGAGTATIGTWLWRLAGLDNSTPSTIADDDAAYFQTNASAASAVVAGTGTAMRLFVEGTFECTAAGTLIPSIDQVTAAAAVVQAGSYFEVSRIGAVDIVSVGSWD